MADGADDDYTGSDHATEADWIEGLPLPREQRTLIGHRVVAETLEDAYRSGRMHHAWILAGPKGIGKATLAFRFARFVLSHPDPANLPPPGDEPLSPVDPRIFDQVAAGGHPNVLHLRRPYDREARKLKTVLTVDEVRRTVSFFGNTAGTRGLRVCIVDAADDMNASAANALLKILEEPPRNAVFLVLSHAPGALLPTIRSRCRRLSLDPLGLDELDAAITGLSLSVEEGERPRLAQLAEGSVRRAVECLEMEGLDLHRQFEAALADAPRLDRSAAHRLAVAASGQGGTAVLDLVGDFARAFLSERLQAGFGRPVRDLEPLAEAWDSVGRILEETRGLNLDRRTAVLLVMQSLAEAVRKPLVEATGR